MSFLILLSMIRFHYTLPHGDTHRVIATLPAAFFHQANRKQPDLAPCLFPSTYPVRRGDLPMMALDHQNNALRPAGYS